MEMTFLPHLPFRLGDVGIVAERVAGLDNECIDTICYERFGEVVPPQNVLLQWWSFGGLQKLKSSGHIRIH